MSQIYATLDDMMKVLKVYPYCSLDSFVVHSFAKTINSPFSVSRIAKLTGFKTKRIAYLLNKSVLIQKSADLYHKKSRMESFYYDGLVEVLGGEVQAITNIEKASVLEKGFHDPLIDACMEFVRQYGDCVSIFEMAILHAVYEGKTSVSAIAELINYDNDKLLVALNNLTEQELLKKQDIGDRFHYTLTHKSSDIFGIIFKAKKHIG
ncbi:hypothetical protein [Endozoicomonas sp.]|uniref:hypothetical protein n=1 Tax=Endozoicomonas sp. TaxID=1892382 RepID=UPI003AF9F0A2